MSTTERNKKIEKLAAIDHEQWIHWSKGTAPVIKDLIEMLSAYTDCMHSNVPSEKSKRLVYESIRPDLILHDVLERMERWERLQNTPYAELSEDYKNDDRKWAVKALEVIEE